MARDELAPDNLMTEKFSRPVIEGFGYFLSDATECLGLSNDFRRLDNFLFDRKVARLHQHEDPEAAAEAQHFRAPRCPINSVASPASRALRI